MAKKHKKPAPLAPAQKDQEEGGDITSRGWKVIALGLGTLVSGFLLLTRTDPAGRNWASDLSPLLILGGYAIIAWGILLPEASEPPPSVPPAA